MMDADLPVAKRFLKISALMESIPASLPRTAQIVVLLLVVFSTSISCVSSAEKTAVITGTATVIDGDTIRVQSQTIRFHGMDAPERNQHCRRGGIRYRCGQLATMALVSKIKRKTVHCVTRNRDRYHRSIAVCQVDGEDLNAWMVLRGHALAYRRYSRDYIPAENVARSERRGIWVGEFIFPWNWRQGKRLD